MEDLDKMTLQEIIQEWSYKCPNGYPSIVDGKFTDRDEVEMLNLLLKEHNYPEQVLPERAIKEALSVSTISSNSTDVKEAMVMSFFDCLRADPSTMAYYDSLYSKPDQAILNKLKDTLKESLKFNSDYGEGVNIANLHNFIIATLGNPDRRKSSEALKLVNNAFSAANSIISNKISSAYIGNKTYATRGSVFNQIRNIAVTELMPKMGVTGLKPDNWCPGDFYLMEDNQIPKADTLYEFNSNFAGPGYPDGNILAISLKMELAQAGKATTFIKSVLQVPEVDASQAHSSNVDSKIGKKYLEAKRKVFTKQYETMAITSPKEVQYVNSKLSGPFKTILLLSKSKRNITLPTIDKWYNMTGPDRKLQPQFLAKNRNAMVKEAQAATSKLDPILLGAEKTLGYEKGFIEAYGLFIKYMNSIGIKNIKGGSVKEFITNIKNSTTAKKAGGVAKILIKKADAYALAIKLIQAWSDKNKQIAKPFQKLGAINNPLLVITMFAIAQHGANPNFIKVHGSDSGLVGTVEMFPAKAVIDESSAVQTIKIVDSPGNAGFDVTYNLTLNKQNYNVKLSFRFSGDTIRVEVQDLEMTA